MRPSTGTPSARASPGDALATHDEVRDFTYGDLKEQSNRFANVLVSLGVGKGDRVFILASRIPELYISALGILKNTSVVCPPSPPLDQSRLCSGSPLAAARCS